MTTTDEDVNLINSIMSRFRSNEEEGKSRLLTTSGPYAKMMDETRDIVVRTAEKVDFIDHSLRDLVRKVDDSNKVAAAHFVKYDDMISRMKGVSWFLSAVSMLAGAFGAFMYHLLWGGK